MRIQAHKDNLLVPRRIIKNISERQGQIIKSYQEKPAKMAKM